AWARLRAPPRASSVVFLSSNENRMFTLRVLRSGIFVAAMIAPVAGFAPLHAQQSNDAEYTAKIRELTPVDPKWKFTTELVDHLPASRSVPTPLKAFGYVPGSPGHLSHVAEINNYFRSVERASPRAKVLSLGKSEEGREMIVAAVADENTIKHLDEYR